MKATDEVVAERLQNCADTVLSIAVLYLRIPQPKVPKEHADAIEQLRFEMECANMQGLIVNGLEQI